MNRLVGEGGVRSLLVLALVLAAAACGDDDDGRDGAAGGDGDGDADADGDGDGDGGLDTDAGEPEACEEQGATRTIDCGFCGTQAQICAADGLWHDDGACDGPGDCDPGAIQTEACGTCGTHERLCSASCAWRPWGDCAENPDGECAPGDEEVTREGCEPGDIQSRRCIDGCRWEAVRACGPDCIGEPRDAGTDAEEVCVPGGPFIMGGADPDSDNDDPEHEVTLYPYFIDRFEVTNERYRECVAAGACSDPKWPDRSYDDEVGRRYPVIFVSVQQAIAFCTWAADRRLPTEAEWEKAARGPSPDRRIYPWGNDPPTCEQAVHNMCPTFGYYEDIDAHPLGGSPFGVERLTDSVPEPVADWYDADYYAESPPVDPRGPDAGEFHAMRSNSDSWGADSYPVLTQRLEAADADGIRCARSAEAR